MAAGRIFSFKSLEPLHPYRDASEVTHIVYFIGAPFTVFRNSANPVFVEVHKHVMNHFAGDGEGGPVLRVERQNTFVMFTVTTL